MEKKKSLAIITARGGSKRIPRKNIRNFFGFPIIKYSIEAALESGCFDEVMVSTDDQEIAKISTKFGAKVPFFRSKATADDFTKTNEVLEEVLLQYQERDQKFTYFCCIYPTAPFVSAGKLREGLSILKNNNADVVLTIVRYSYPIQRALKIENGKVSMVLPENISKRSQDLPPTYHDAGQFYWFRTEAFLNNEQKLFPNTVAIELRESEVQDIDDEDDWKLAEMKCKIMQDKNLPEELYNEHK